jgi:hypothetical protein
MYEASTNFDLENVEPFLRRLDSQMNLGLPISDLMEMTRATKPEQEMSRSTSVRFKGATVDLEYRVFMDDIDSPDLYFFTSSKELANSIEEQMMEFADELGL